jgi:hypothetical protein
MTTSTLEAAQAWWSARKPLIAFGSATWKTNGWGANPKVALYDVNAGPKGKGKGKGKGEGVATAEGGPSEGDLARAQGAADSGAGDAEADAGRWVFDPTEAAGPTRKRAVTLTSVGDGKRQLQACHQDAVKVSGAMTFSGQWRWEGTGKKEGSRSQLVVQWENGKGEPLQDEARRQTVAHANPGDGHWKKVEETLSPPPAAKRGRICLRARLASGSVQAQGLRLATAEGAVASAE